MGSKIKQLRRFSVYFTGNMAQSWVLEPEDSLLETEDKVLLTTSNSWITIERSQICYTSLVRYEVDVPDDQPKPLKPPIPPTVEENLL